MFVILGCITIEIVLIITIPSNFTFYLNSKPSESLILLGLGNGISTEENTNSIELMMIH